MASENATIVKPAECKALQVRPRSELEGSEAYERSPTLLAGEAPGSQGQVQVWSPQKWRLWVPALLWSLVAAWFVIDPFVEAHPGHGLFTDLVRIGQAGVYALLAWMWVRWQTYLTTDDAGIGIAQRFCPARAIRWSEIESIDTMFNLGPASYLTVAVAGSDRPLVVNLAGYPAAKRREILDLILKRAELTTAPFQIRKHVRSSGDALAEPRPGRLNAR